MRRIELYKTVSIGACLFIAAGLSSAAEVFPLFGTGIGVSAGSQDPNWVLVSDPGGAVGTSPYVTDGSTFPVGTFPFSSSGWFKDGSFGSDSKWLSPAANETTSNAAGEYVYTQTFSLTGFDPSSVVIDGEWSADNYGEILINGVPVTGVTDGDITNAAGQFHAFTSFVLNSSDAGFTTGVNTITFEAFNTTTGSPDVTGFNVDIESDSATAVPEPASIGLMGLGLAALGWGARKLGRG
jgi:hypothetical protein